MSKPNYKFRLHYLLRQLKVDDYEVAMKLLPELLGISKSTFLKWIYLTEDSYYDLPFCTLIKLSTFFKVKPIEIYNEQIQERINESIASWAE